jgi:hypothetical protein
MFDDSQEVGEEDASQIMLGIAFDVVEDKEAKKHKMLKIKKNKGYGGKKVEEVKGKTVEENKVEEVEENNIEEVKKVEEVESESSGTTGKKVEKVESESSGTTGKKVEEVESESSGTTGKKVEKVESESSGTTGKWLARPKFQKLKRCIYIEEEEEEHMPFTSEEMGEVMQDMRAHLKDPDEHMKKIRAAREEELAAIIAMRHENYVKKLARDEELAAIMLRGSRILRDEQLTAMRAKKLPRL